MEYLVRVILHADNYYEHPDYNGLHEAMSAANFKKQIISTKNIAYHMPVGEYIISLSNSSTDEVWEMVYNIVEEIHTNSSVIVYAINDVTWSGLEKV